MMQDIAIKKVGEIRLLVGFLGEIANDQWWDCSFFSSASESFLSPIFPKTTFLSIYNGVSKAAQLVHDKRIGVGKHYHLFRLPDSIEQATFKMVNDSNFVEQVEVYLSSKDEALKRLSEITNDDSNSDAEGPIAVGHYSDANLSSLLPTVCGHYSGSIKNNRKAFPFIRC
jgi:hypothetical protein